MPKVKVVDELKVEPSGEFILVKVDPDNDETRAQGKLIIIPQKALQNKKTQTGVIVAVGEGRRNPHNPEQRIPMDCEVGERILFATFIGYPIMIDDDEHVMIKCNDKMGCVDEVAHYDEINEDDIESPRVYI